jgi:predicted enzyme related to lactoylglutathione lyase
MSRVVHFEIHAKDQDKVQKFYEGAFGWEFKNLGPEMGNYRVVTTGTEAIGINGGMNSVPSHAPADGQPINAFVCIIGVGDIAETLQEIKAAGGTVTENVMDVPTIGKLAYCKDVEGNLFGVLQPVEMSLQGEN